MIDALTIVSVYLILTVMSLLSGSVFFLVLFPKYLTNDNPIRSILVSLALGLPLSTAVLWIIGQFYFSGIVVWSMVAVLLIIAIAVLWHRWDDQEPVLTSESAWNGPAAVFFSLLALFALGYYASVALFLGWPQAGDPWRVGTMVALILENAILPLNYLPMANRPVTYPLGFPVACAAASVTTGCLPAEALLLVASYIMGLIPLLLAWISYEILESKSWALATYLLSFYLHPADGALYSLVNMFYNGSYAMVYGTALSLSSIGLFLAIRRDEEGLSAEGIVTQIIIAFGIFVVYPAFIVIPGLLLFLSILRSGKCSLGGDTPRSKSVLFLALAVSIAGIIGYTQGYFDFILNHLTNPSSFVGFAIPSDYYSNNLMALFTTIAVLAAAVKMAFDRFQVSDLAYLILSLLLLLSMNDYLFSLGLRYLLPKRLNLVVTSWTYIYVTIAIAQIGKVVSRGAPLLCVSGLHDRLSGKVFSKINRGTLYKAVGLVTVFMLVLPSLVSAFTFEISSEKDWLVNNERFEDDISVMIYLQSIAGPNDTILNYPAYSDLFLPSLGLLDAVNVYYADKNRSRALMVVWEQPDNESMMQSLIEQYEIRYVIVSSVSPARNLIDETGGLMWRPYPPSEYIVLFNTYGFLSRIYQQGNCALYEAI